jgi:NADH dehydrogenase FAD-containing subunit
MSFESKRIVVLGAGYAGLMAALRLSGKTEKQNTEIVLVHGSDTFVQRPRLHNTATGQEVPERCLTRFSPASRNCCARNG